MGLIVLLAKSISLGRDLNMPGLQVAMKSDAQKGNRGKLSDGNNCFLELCSRTRERWGVSLVSSTRQEAARERASKYAKESVHVPCGNEEEFCSFCLEGEVRGVRERKELLGTSLY